MELPKYQGRWGPKARRATERGLTTRERIFNFFLVFLPARVVCPAILPYSSTYVIWLTLAIVSSWSNIKP